MMPIKRKKRGLTATVVLLLWMFLIQTTMAFTSLRHAASKSWVRRRNDVGPMASAPPMTSYTQSKLCSKTEDAERNESELGSSNDADSVRGKGRDMQPSLAGNDDLPSIPGRGGGGSGGVGGYDPSGQLPGRREQVIVGEPQKRVEKEMSVTSILKELTAIQEQGPQKYCVLGTRHCSYLHQRIIELLAYALVLSGNHVYTSGAGGTHAATIRGALRAERPDLLTVVLPQSLEKQPKESQELLKDVSDLIEMPQGDNLSLDVASRKCNSYMLSCTDHLIAFAFHESKTVLEATKEARKEDMLVTTLFLD